MKKKLFVLVIAIVVVVNLSHSVTYLGKAEDNVPPASIIFIY